MDALITFMRNLYFFLLQCLDIRDVIDLVTLSQAVCKAKIYLFLMLFFKDLLRRSMFRRIELKKFQDLYQVNLFHNILTWLLFISYDLGGCMDFWWFLLY
jgi:hypothetical protein